MQPILFNIGNVPKMFQTRRIKVAFPATNTPWIFEIKFEINPSYHIVRFGTGMKQEALMLHHGQSVETLHNRDVTMNGFLEEQVLLLCFK